MLFPFLGDRFVRKSIAIGVLLFACVVAWGKTSSATGTAPASKAVAEKKLVVVKLKGEITEAPPGIDLGFGDLQTNVFWDQLRLVRMIKNDAAVAGLVLLINDPNLSLAQCQQLAMELDRLRKAGKKVFVHADSIPTNLYLLALASDTLAMSPGTTLEMTGLAVQIIYYKNLMEFLGIEAQVEHCGAYKLFAEPYTATRPSKYMDEQINDLLDSLYGQIVSAISQHRKMSEERAKSILDRGPFLAEQAKDAGLIDRVAYRHDLVEEARKATGGKPVYDYGRTATPAMKGGLSGLLQIFSMVGSKAGQESGNRIAIVYVTGMVTEGESESLFGPAETAGSETMRKVFAKINEDNGIKAVVVRVDSPGGMSSASEIIWKLIWDTAKTRPVITSMGEMAGSGGYYVAAAGDVVLASEGTLTGSIGVVAGKPVMAKLLEKIHLNAYTYSRGKNATMNDPFSAMTPDQRKTFQDQIALIFQTFKDRMMISRKGKIKDIDALATGRVYTGEQGVGLGLVDRIGTLADAVDLAAERAKLKNYQVVQYPQPKTLPDILLEALGYRTDDDGVMMDDRLRPLSALIGAGSDLNLAGIDLRMIRQALRMVKMMQTGGVLAVSPYQIRLR